jgi:hypothetical protein
MWKRWVLFEKRYLDELLEFGLLCRVSLMLRPTIKCKKEFINTGFNWSCMFLNPIFNSSALCECQGYKNMMSASSNSDILGKRIDWKKAQLNNQLIILSREQKVKIVQYAKRSFR